MRNKVITGALWSYVQQFGTQAVQFLVTVILARIIAPADFGLIGMIMIFVGVGTALFEGGLTNSLIRSNDLEDDDFSTVFIFNVLSSFIIYIILFFIAPFISNFYKQPILTDLLRVYSISFIISSFAAVHNTILVKQMKFRKIAVITFPAVILSGLSAVLMAFNNFGVWSLVYSALINAFFTTLILWFNADWKPKLIFNKEKFRLHFEYGNKMMISSVLDIIFVNLYQIVIGKIYSATLLGYYTRANSLMMLPVTNISGALNKVAFPTFSQMQNDEQKLRSTYKKMMLMVIYTVTPVMVIMIVLGENLVVFLFTDKWLPVVPVFQILCVTGILYPLHLYNLIILQVKGKSGLFLYLEIIKKILAVVSLVISYFFGFYGLLWGQVIFSVLCLFINTHYAGVFLKYNLWKQLQDLLPLFLVALIMGAVVYFVKNYFLTNLPDFWVLLLGTVTGLIFYIFLSAILKFSTFFEIKRILLKK
ncbi:lipopolysaccharide biosynthesis protein [Chryseobacterium sp. GCR10]|uniref:Lipopolysaccharide biosynthesis protein n=1 Tax=Chryseobacterium caseinilyticum TaxID=2771428 RepID=A0ABR8ZBQ4_9FLAO|nr:lipopolysaccharide biosynthesis protein [Chryseobacterium caseinilyticum]